jgi:subtilisin-like proprotein convertase family protein
VISSRRLRGLTCTCLWAIAGAGACAQAETSPDSAPIDSPPPVDAAVDAVPIDANESSGFFEDTTPADFGSGALTDVVVEAWGAIAPRAYYTGGLRVRGNDTATFTNAATATWAGVEAGIFTSAAAPGRSIAVDWTTATPAGVGLTAGDDFTLGYDGEIYLEGGTWTFHVLADDHAFLELAPIGSTGFTRVASANVGAEATGTFVASADGWYPVRLGYCERTGSAALRVEMRGPTIATRAPVPRHRLRFAASGMDGLAVAAFDDSRMLGDTQTTIDRAMPAARNYGTAAPADLGITAADDFSVRWTGQLRIDVGGDYVFRYVTDDGQRLWIDGALVQDFFDATPHDTMTSPIALDPGWHDLVVDLSESVATAQATLSVVSGPDLVGASLPAARLRPVEARSERHDSGVDRTDRAIPDAGQVDSIIAIDAPPGAKTHGIDVSWTFDHGYRGDLELILIAPDGSQTVVRDHVGGAATGTVTERVHVTALDETTASGVWRLRARDTVSLDTGTLRDFQLTVHHRAGRPPIAPTASFVSTVKDLGDMVTAYTSFSWQARMGAGTTIKVYVRSGDTLDAALAAPWSTPLVDPAGGSPPVVARRYFQYRIDFESDGDGTAMVDSVRLDTRREVP